MQYQKENKTLYEAGQELHDAGMSLVSAVAVHTKIDVLMDKILMWLDSLIVVINQKAKD